MKNYKDIKKILGLFFLLIILPILIFPAYKVSVAIINRVDKDIIYKYVTEGNFEKDLFFNKELDKKTQIYDTLNQTGVEIKSNDTIPSYFTSLLKEKENLIKLVSANKLYMAYLEENKLEIKDLITYMEYFTEYESNILYEDLLNGVLYVIALVYILILYFGFKYRKRIYCVAGVIYFIAILNDFSGGIAGNLLYPSVCKLMEANNQSFTYKEFFTMYTLFIPIIKEALLTYIIIDTVAQAKQDEKDRKISFEVKYIYYSLDIIQTGLTQLSKTKEILPVRNIKLNFIPLYKICKKNKRDYVLSEILVILDANKELTDMNLNKKNYEELLDKLSDIESYEEKLQLIKTHNDSLLDAIKYINILVKKSQIINKYISN